MLLANGQTQISYKEVALDKENVLVFLKPDGVLIKDLLAAALFNQDGLEVQEIGSFELDELRVRAFYHYLPEETIKKCIRYLANQSLPAYVIIGVDATNKIKKLKKILRDRWGKNRTGALLHSTDKPEEFEHEIRLLDLRR